MSVREGRAGAYSVLSREAVPGLSALFLSMYSPRAHPGPPSPMDSEILIKPLSLWPKYSTGALLIL